MIKTIFWHFFSILTANSKLYDMKFQWTLKVCKSFATESKESNKKKNPRDPRLWVSENPGVIKITNSDRPFLEHHYYLHVISCLIYAHELRRKCLKKYINFTIFTTNYLPLRRERLVKLTISCLLAIQINRM